MAWTQADLDAVDTAIMKLVSGERVVTIGYTGAGQSNRSASYGIVQLGELRALRAEIQRAVSGTPGYRLASTRKGLGL